MKPISPAGGGPVIPAAVRALQRRLVQPGLIVSTDVALCAIKARGAPNPPEGLVQTQDAVLPPGRGQATGDDGTVEVFDGPDRIFDSPCARIPDSLTDPAAGNVTRVRVTIQIHLVEARLGEQLDALRGGTYSQEEEIRALKADVRTLRGEVATLATQIGWLQGEVGGDEIGPSSPTTRHLTNCSGRSRKPVVASGKRASGRRRCNVPGFMLRGPPK